MKKLKNVDTYVKQIFSANNVEEKKKIFNEMISVSTGTNSSKQKALLALSRMNSVVEIDTLAFNYSSSGEGLSVLK